MSRTAWRAHRLGTTSVEPERDTDLAPRDQVHFACPHGHRFAVPFAADAELPATWECRTHGIEHCHRINADEIPAKKQKPARTHLVLLRERRSDANGGRVAGPAAEALLNNELSQDTVDWLKSNFFKTELELGHCLRLPAEGPCECDLYLRCSKFFTTSEYAPRLRSRLAREQQLIQDAVERNWPREIERHEAITRRIQALLTDLGEPYEAPTEPDE
jgi:hypothetical protein